MWINLLWNIFRQNWKGKKNQLNFLWHAFFIIGQEKRSPVQADICYLGKL